MRTVEFLIIGQGLAGSLLAYSLIKRGCKVLVLDNAHTGCATQVAAGLINPITGHRLNITERFFEYSTEAKKLYWQIERDLGCAIYSPIRQTRLIKNAGQAQYLEKRAQQVEYQDLLAELEDTGEWFTDREKFPYGAINVSLTAVVDTKRLLHHIKQWLLEREALICTSVDYDSLKPSDQGISYVSPDIEARADKLIFCEGFQAIHNPWLKNLPFKLAKGEILTVKPDQPIERMLSWGNWLVPNNNGNAKLGANYIWGDTTLSKLPNTLDDFLTKQYDFTGATLSPVSHEVGIRPTTKQRTPFVGPLTNLKNAYCFNGLGSKGCLIAPHYVSLLCDHLLTHKSLPEENTQWL